MHPQDAGTLAGLTDTTDQPLRMPPALEGIPQLVTTSVPIVPTSTIIAGHWPFLLVGIRSQIRIEVLRERYADEMAYGFLAAMRADVAAEHENAFVKITGITA
jgi:HK97 family phage major capsid protein